MLAGTTSANRYSSRLPNGDREDDGVVVTVAFDVEAEHSRLLVLDGLSFTERARFTLPHAAPFDFHGRYLPELRATATEDT